MGDNCERCSFFFSIVLFILALVGIIITPIKLKNLQTSYNKLENISPTNFTIANKTYDISKEVNYYTYCQNDASLLQCSSVYYSNLTSGYCQDGYYCCDYSSKPVRCVNEVYNVMKQFNIVNVYYYTFNLISQNIDIYYSFTSYDIYQNTSFIGYIYNDNLLTINEINQQIDNTKQNIDEQKSLLYACIIYWSVFGFSLLFNYLFYKKSQKRIITLY
jgi:hypothetical protein